MISSIGQAQTVKQARIGHSLFTTAMQRAACSSMQTARDQVKISKEVFNSGFPIEEGKFCVQNWMSGSPITVATFSVWMWMLLSSYKSVQEQNRRCLAGAGQGENVPGA